MCSLRQKYVDQFWNALYICNMTNYNIVLYWDNDAAVWIAENNEIPIALESGSLDVLMERVKNAAPELLELNGKNNSNITLNFSMECQRVVA